MPDERIYINSDADLGIERHPDNETIRRHRLRYISASESFASGRRGTNYDLLDIGCGSGYGSLFLPYRYTGIDCDPTAITFANKHYANRQARFIQCDVLSFKPDRTFDMICCIEMLEHLTFSNQMTLLSLISEWLAPDGTLFLTAPVLMKLHGSANRDNPYHLHEPGLLQLYSLLLNHGFDRIDSHISIQTTTTGHQQVMGEFTCRRSSQ